MSSLRSKHRWFGMGFLLAWALSHAAAANAQNAAPANPPSPADKIRRSLDQVIALDYQGNSFTDAIAHVKDRTQLPIAIDQMALQQVGLVDGGPINLEIRNVRGKLRSVLSNVLNNHGLTYVILEEELLITTEASAIQRQMRQRVPIDVDEVPASKALRDVAKKAGISLVIDPRVAKSAAQKVSLQLEEASVETGLRLIAELADVKAVRMGNVIFVTDAARARAIRSEETATDSPFGPPIMIERGIGFGGAIIGGGAQAVPVPPPAVEVAPEKKE